MFTRNVVTREVRRVLLVVFIQSCSTLGAGTLADQTLFKP
jgi:hypothetical protein